MFEKILNIIFFRGFRVKRIGKKLLESIESEIAEDFLELLLKLMGLVFLLDREFRRNIEDFSGKYLFKSKDNSITALAVFERGKLKVSEEETDNPNITVIFKDSKALMNYILSPKPDILGSMLRQDVVLDGNLNYLYKFAFMAKRLQLMVAGDM